MKTYLGSGKPEEVEEDQKPPEKVTPKAPPCNDDLAREVYQWDHALKIASERLWGHQAPSLRIVHRKKG
jgi:hypothetical protein